MYEAVEPARRPTKRRRGARVLLRCQGRVLLISDCDPGVAGSQWWVLPGGGIDAGESSRTAAVREVLEETGLRLDPDELRGPIAQRVVTHGYSDRVLVQAEDIYLADVAWFEPEPAELSAGEKLRLAGWQWFDADQLRDEVVWPPEVARWLAWAGEECEQLGEVDESTVPVAGSFPVGAPQRQKTQHGPPPG